MRQDGLGHAQIPLRRHGRRAVMRRLLVARVISVAMHAARCKRRGLRVAMLAGSETLRQHLERTRLERGLDAW